MTKEEFEKIVAEEFEKAIPEKFRPHIKNIALLIEEEPPYGGLLGLYHGIPTPMRGDWYGMGATLPDTITLYQKTIEDCAKDDGVSVGQVIRETIWHEVAHHFGFDEEQVQRREEERSDNIDL